VQSEETVIEIAASQGGIVTRQQALTAGMTARQIAYRLKQQRWTAVRRGVYEVFKSTDPDGVVRAAAASLPGAVVGLFSAAKLHGIGRRLEGPETVLVHSSTTHVFGGVSVVRCHDLQPHHVTTIGRLRITVVSRTVVDLAPRIPFGALAALVDDAVTRTETTSDQIGTTLAEVARKGRPGVVALRTILQERSGSRPDRSVLEMKGLRVLEDWGIEDFEVEYPMPWDRKRRFDIAFPRERLAIEWDGRFWHETAQAFQVDRERDRTALTHGWRVVRFTWEDVVDRPISVGTTLRDLLNRGSVGR
jgi:very-short-patch-repair endonuclease